MSNNKKVSDEDIRNAVRGERPWEKKRENDKETDSKIVRAVKKIDEPKDEEGKVSDEEIVAIVSKQKLASESLKKLNELVKKKRIEMPIDLLTERDSMGRIRFIIREKTEDEEDDLEIQRDEFNKPIFMLKEKEKQSDKVKNKVEVIVEDLQEDTVITDQFLGKGFNEAVILPADGIIKNVCLIGKVSKNNRIYSDEALETIAEKANGIRVFADHSELGEKYRKLEKWLGEIKNPKKIGDKVYGDFYVLKHKDWMLNIARQMPEGCGFSIVGKGKTETLSDGKTDVVALTHLSSIDVVMSPATTTSLFDHIEEEFKTQKVCEGYNTEVCAGKMLAENYELCEIFGSGNSSFFGICPYADESLGTD